MSIQVALHHLTEYRFDRAVGIGPHVLRLRPAPHCRTPILAYSLRVRPARHFLNWQQDPFGNYQARLVFPEVARQLTIEVDLVADLTAWNPFDFFLEPYAEHYPFDYEPALARSLAPYLECVESGPLLQGLVAGVPRSRRRAMDLLVEFNAALRERVAYVLRMEPGVQTCEATLALGRGSCRDSAWLLVQALRHLGLAARFVSGYLVQLAPDVPPLDGPPGPAADFTDLHAWVEVYLPGAGWVGLDPTSGLLASEGHIPLACTPDPAEAAPVTGATGICEVEFGFANRVTRVAESPRSTRPYDPHQWACIQALADRVDADLAAADVRLTMGGEPTFVAIDDVDLPEWNTEALGPRKRVLAEALFLRLVQRWSPGAVRFYGQGKWYPGEPLPRWALTAFWRSDGVPVWRDPGLLAEPTRPGQATLDDAAVYARALAVRLGLAEAAAQPAFEDALYYLWKDAQVPLNVDLSAASTASPEARATLTRLLEQDPSSVVGLLARGLGQVAGYVLPLSWSWQGAGGWRSSLWQFRRGRLHLIPGDSPIGYRLPLDTLPWVSPDLHEPVVERSLFEPPPPLATEVALRIPVGDWTPTATRIAPQPAAADDVAPASRLPPGSVSETVRTALTVEVREGRLHVFLPPLGYLEHWLDLVARIEDAAAACGLPVVLEGYPAPIDLRLRRFAVTPDPGVIEVNVHPAASLAELRERTETLYEEARAVRLGTEKFLIDGRQTGTGGGNHLTLGGATPADSPLLRRPDLLRSLLTYWQQHPALSYVFSGLFVGPTSQAPRIDEARDDVLHELAIAFAQMPEGEVPQPWLVDRLLRHLLTDVTGNTHRAEFSIDKLYSPDGPTGRLGVLELRAFEMPPHARMACVQQLLVAALVAWFWREPRRSALVPWGTALHDRYMLPHFLWQDLREVVADLDRAGHPMDLEWFAPFLAFRFPVYGDVQVGGLRLELRMAVEPWHVLGEEPVGGGTARFVDSSVERLQVRVTGLAGARFVVCCNGRRLPLRATAQVGEGVAGVRYRAWQPASALHPTIPVHVPLVFDVVDTWTGRAVGGCTYRVAHAGGRSYSTLPVNGAEAESRRVARFDAFGHTPGRLVPLPRQAGLVEVLPFGSGEGPMSPPVEERNLDFPLTLDLRHPPSA